MKVDKEKYGLVLAGGGGKGGYEIGVWKALKESKTLSIGAVSGTSVGALNAALYAAGDYDNAEDLWKNITQDKILTPAMFTPENIFKTLKEIVIAGTPYFASEATIIKGIGIVGSQMGKAVGKAGAEVLIKRYISGRGGMFSREGLSQMIEQSGILDRINEESIPCYATCYNFTHKRLQSFLLNKESKEKITSILLASSAIPLVFPKEKIDNNEYYDGGLPFVGDNIPVKPLYDLDFRKFIVVHLDRDGVDSFSQRFPDARFIHVFPKKDQGNFKNGTLDFNPKNAVKRIKEGYEDMKHQIEMLNNIDKSLVERGERLEEIHIYSGKYYGSLESILSNADIKGNTCLLEDSDFKFDDLDTELTELARNLNSNAKDMDKFVLEGITHISAMDAQMDELHRSKGFKSLWNTITGKNKRLKQAIDGNLINAQQATSNMICKLVETDSMSVELIRTVQSQLQGATIKMGKVLEQHGYEIISIKNDYEKIAQLYGELVLHDQEIAEEINSIYKVFFDNVKTSDIRFRNIENEITELANVQRLQNWRMNIKYRTYGRTDYKDLDIYEKIVCITSDFFFLTRGQWDDELVLFLKGALDSLEISPYEIVSYDNLIYKLLIDNELRNYLFERNSIKIHISNAEGTVVPHYEAIVDGLCIGERVLANEDIDVEAWISNFMNDRTGESYLEGNTAFDIICEMLIIMKLYSQKMKTDDILPAYRDIKKAALLGDTEAECQYVGLLLDHNHVEDAFNWIIDMENRCVDGSEFVSLRDRVIERYSML